MSTNLKDRLLKITNHQKDILKQLAKFNQQQKEAKRIADLDRKIRYFKDKILKNLPKKLEEVASQSQNSYIIHYGASECPRDIKTLVSNFAKENGLNFTDISYLRNSDRGDRDSGKGQCESGWVSEYELSW